MTENNQTQTPKTVTTAEMEKALDEYEQSLNAYDVSDEFGLTANDLETDNEILANDDDVLIATELEN